MPVYFILSRSIFSKEEKEEITKTVTDVHCNITGAPSSYVTLLFLSGYRLKEGKRTMLLGNIRTGGNRTQDIIDRLEYGLLMAMANTLSLSSTNIEIKFLGVEPHWVWEGGEVLPPPGEECEKVLTDITNKWNHYIENK